MNTTNTKETTRDTTAPMADTLPRKETTQDTTAPTADTLPTSPERQPASPQAESPTRTPNPDPLHQQGEQQVEATDPISHTPPATDEQPCPSNIHTRPLRARHPPKRYEPETVRWLDY